MVTLTLEYLLSRQGLVDTGGLMFVLFMVSTQIFDFYYNLLPDILLLFKTIIKLFLQYTQWCRSQVEQWQQVLNDFSNRTYYNPLKRQQHVYVWSKKHISELSEAPELSQRAVYSDLFNFKMTLNIEDPDERLTIRYRTFGRVLQTMSPANFPSLHPHMQKRLSDSFAEGFRVSKISDGWATVAIAPLLKKATIETIGLIMFGETLLDEPDFGSAMFRYPKDMIRTMGFLAITPAFLKPLVHRITTSNGRAMHVLLQRLMRVVETGGKDWSEVRETEKLTVLHNMMESAKESNYWNPHNLAQALIGIWFASSHQPWVNIYFILLELCIRPDQAKILREELFSQVTLDSVTLNGLPLLDSFMKETIRFSPGDRLSVRRKALKPFTFSENGPRVPLGSIACVSNWDILHDPQKYPNPYEFDAARFARSKADGGTRGHRLTDVSEDFPLWGYGSRACPGRFHASFVMKTVLAHILMHYDFRLEDERAATYWNWESFKMPHEGTKMLFRKRDAGDGG